MRLLLVEDDVMVASGIKLGLTDAGYAVDWVGSGERAEEVLRAETFDAAIIDIGLPAIDGLQLTQALRDQGHTMPVLILTARDALQDRVQGLDMGADDYMIKPFELPEMLARLRALLRRSQAATSAGSDRRRSLPANRAWSGLFRFITGKNAPVCKRCRTFPGVRTPGQSRTSPRCDTTYQFATITEGQVNGLAREPLFAANSDCFR